MPEFVIFLRPTDPVVERSPSVIRAHCQHLDELDRQNGLIAAGPFADAADGGMVVGRFSSLGEAEKFARADPFVHQGYSRADIRAWEWSHGENGHLGVLAPAPGSHPRFLRTLALRVTTREFSTRPIDRELVRDLLDAARGAPSDFNLQPWRPVVCHESLDRERLQRCCLDQTQVGASALAVVCSVDPELFQAESPRAVDEFIDRGRIPAEGRDKAIRFFRDYFADSHAAAIRNGSIFGHQLLLAGVSQGLAGFWLGGIDEAAIRREFGLPERAVVAGIVGLGWPKGRVQRMPRQPLDRLVGWGRWPDAS